MGHAEDHRVDADGRVAADRIRPRPIGTPWVRDELLRMHFHLHLIRGFEEAVLQVHNDGLVHGPAHSSIGQEGGAVGSIAPLRPTIRSAAPIAAIISSWPRRSASDRAPAIPLADPLPASDPGGAPAHPRRDHGAGRRAIAEAAADRCICGGSRRARSARMRSSAAACPWPRAPRGRCSATGTRRRRLHLFRRRRRQYRSVPEFLQSRRPWKLAGVLLHREQRLCGLDYAEEVTPSHDVLAGPRVWHSVLTRRRHGPARRQARHGAAPSSMRSGKGPALIEAVSIASSIRAAAPGSAFGYRSKEEEAEWKRRDPLARVAQR